MKVYGLLNNIVFSIIYWVFASYYFIAIRFLGFEHETSLTLSEDIYLQALFPGIIIGILLGLRESINALKLKKRQSFIFILVFNTVLYICFFVLVIFLTSLYGNSFSFALTFIFSEIGVSLLIHLSFFSLLFHFILQMNKKFGPGILPKYISGNYFNPHDEERIFLFLDLKNSTAIAEKLGHISYSKLLQDCYAELTDSIQKYNAQIYQYVGDEVVITWKTKRGVFNLNCIKFFFAFKKRLKEKSNYFLKFYGITPEFKAGIHCGNVTVAEVGILKTEIAYHGDTLNTASRIQGLCNNYDEQFLASKELLDQLTEDSNFQYRFIGNLMLRGKGKAVKVFSVRNLIEST